LAEGEVKGSFEFVGEDAQQHLRNKWYSVTEFFYPLNTGNKLGVLLTDWSSSSRIMDQEQLRIARRSGEVKSSTESRSLRILSWNESLSRFKTLDIRRMPLF